MDTYVCETITMMIKIFLSRHQNFLVPLYSLYFLLFLQGNHWCAICHCKLLSICKNLNFFSLLFVQYLGVKWLGHMVGVGINFKKLSNILSADFQWFHICWGRTIRWHKPGFTYKLDLGNCRLPTLSSVLLHVWSVDHPSFQKLLHGYSLEI